MHKEISYEELVEQYYSIVFGYILKKIEVWQDAEDLTQDIFLNCHKNWEQYDPNRASVSTWLFAVTDNRLKNYYRDKKPNVPFSEIDQPILDKEYNLVEEIIDQAIVKETFNKVQVCLNERQRKAIWYRYFSQLKMEEVAKKLSCSEENARVIVHRAIKKMKRYAESHGIQWSIEIK